MSAAGGPGVVVIGRNEGERLVRSLQAALRDSERVVYVDSGSADGSVARARALGVEVVELDPERPFTAARGRHEGLLRLLERWPATELVQFVDGDCELQPGWLESGRDFLALQPRYAAAHGRRRETAPEASIYNRLCDEEWNVSPGDVPVFGGDVLVRVRAYREVGGYDASLIAGEDPDLAVRLRLAGWRIRCLDRDMTLHDAAMTRFSQWWRRTVRAGYAFALGAHRHGATAERHWVREALRPMLWSLGPSVIVLLLLPSLGAPALLVYAVYPLQFLRLFAGARGDLRFRAAQATALLLGKFAELQGQLSFLRDRLVRRRARLIEYK